MSLQIYEQVRKDILKTKSTAPRELAEALGIRVRYRILGELKGLYCCIDRCRYILINQELCDEEIRMVLAHEIGHDRLHQKIARQAPLKEFMIYNYESKQEYEANLYAANLLIDDDELLSLITEYDLISAACRLNVNPHMLTFKLVSMAQRGYLLNLSEEPNSTFLKESAKKLVSSEQGL